MVAPTLPHCVDGPRPITGVAVPFSRSRSAIWRGGEAGLVRSRMAGHVVCRAPVDGMGVPHLDRVE